MNQKIKKLRLTFFTVVFFVQKKKIKIAMMNFSALIYFRYVNVSKSRMLFFTYIL